MEMDISLQDYQYKVFVERGLFSKLHQYFQHSGNIVCIYDAGVPKQYKQIFQQQYPNTIFYEIQNGESSKSITTYLQICDFLIQHNIQRQDCIVALGGGVVGDLAGFVAASYKRGIDFYNIPTTTLSQIDSSIGGKTGIDYHGVKNIIGTFTQPRAVYIDPLLLDTLDDRIYYSGLVEAMKVGLLNDSILFELMESQDIKKHIEEIIWRSLCVKKKIIEEDEHENGIRKILNFGHTLGHAIESVYHLQTYTHGECVAIGMLAFVEDHQLKQRMLTLYQKLGLPTHIEYSLADILTFMKADKKAKNSNIEIIVLKSINNPQIITMDIEDIEKRFV